MNIRKLREQRGWSQEQLAEMSGLSVRTIQRIENGESASAETLKALAAVFEIPLSELQAEQEAGDPGKHVLTPEEQSVLREIRRIRGFRHHLMIYVLVMALLVAINLMGRTEKLWILWPAFGWGIGLAFHALSAYRPFRWHDRNWERREFEKRMAKRRQV